MKRIRNIDKMVRGALIVLEGCDRSGKTTQCEKLVTALQHKNIKVKKMNFPDRSTAIGQIIHQYLVSKVELPDEVIHLLFSANRWELSAAVKKDLLEGTTLIVDRYAYSGVAFTAAKGLELEWCKAPDIGLPRPDKVFLLTLTPEAQAKRKGFGEERYEQTDFQRKVMDNFLRLRDPSWELVDADRTVEELHLHLLESSLTAHESVQGQDILPLWK